MQVTIIANGQEWIFTDKNDFITMLVESANTVNVTTSSNSIQIGTVLIINFENKCYLFDDEADFFEPLYEQCDDVINSSTTQNAIVIHE